MSLDLVELVMRVEEEFEVTIPDEVAATFITPRRILNYLQSVPEIAEKYDPETLSEKLWLIIEDEAPIVRSEVNDDSRFIEDMGMG